MKAYRLLRVLLLVALPSSSAWSPVHIQPGDFVYTPQLQAAFVREIRGWRVVVQFHPSGQHQELELRELGWAEPGLEDAGFFISEKVDADGRAATIEAFFDNGWFLLKAFPSGELFTRYPAQLTRTQHPPGVDCTTPLLGTPRGD